MKLATALVFVVVAPDFPDSRIGASLKLVGILSEDAVHKDFPDSRIGASLKRQV